ncbi:hypothetical protein QAS_4116, partial [Clostridioides difficile CD9]
FIYRDFDSQYESIFKKHTDFIKYILGANYFVAIHIDIILKKQDKESRQVN